MKVKRRVITEEHSDEMDHCRLSPEASLARQLPHIQVVTPMLHALLRQPARLLPRGRVGVKHTFDPSEAAWITSNQASRVGSETRCRIIDVIRVSAFSTTPEKVADGKPEVQLTKIRERSDHY